MNINRKIYLKGLTSNVNLLVKSNYEICQYHNFHREYILQVNNALYDIVSTDPKLYVHKHIIGGFFTYRISRSVTDEFDNTDNKTRRAYCDDNIHLVLKL